MALQWLETGFRKGGEIFIVNTWMMVSRALNSVELTR
jgi:hypothetical protein